MLVEVKVKIRNLHSSYMQVWEKILDFQTSVILFSSPELWFLAVGKLHFTYISGHQVWSSVTMFFWTWWYKTHKHCDTTKLIKVTLAHMFWQNIHLTPVGFLIWSETCLSGVHVQLNIVMGVGSMVWACPSPCMHTVQVTLTSLCRCHLSFPSRGTCTHATWSVDSQENSPT